MSTSSLPQISVETATTYGQFLKELNTKLSNEKGSYIGYQTAFVIAGLFSITILVLSILTLCGVMAPCGGIYWKCAVAGTVCGSLMLSGSISFLIVVVDMVKYYLNLKKIKKELAPSTLDKQLDCNPFIALPPEINLMIFNHLGKKDLAITSRVSKQWNEFSSYTHFWKKLIPQVTDPEIKNIIEKDPHHFLCQVYKTKSNKMVIASLVSKLSPSRELAKSTSTLMECFRQIVFPT